MGKQYHFTYKRNLESSGVVHVYHLEKIKKSFQLIRNKTTASFELRGHSKLKKISGGFVLVVKYSPRVDLVKCY